VAKVTYTPAREISRPVAGAFYDPAVETADKISLVAPTAAVKSIERAMDMAGVLSPAAMETAHAPELYRLGAALPQLVIMCGCGFRDVPGPPQPDGTYASVTQEYIPTYTGVAVEQDLLYGFSAMLKVGTASEIRVGIMWFKTPGRPIDQISVIESDPVGAESNDNWKLFTVQGEPPDTATYLVPYVRLLDTYEDLPFYMMGDMVYIVGPSGAVIALAPDKYMKLGDAAKLLGTDPTMGGGWLIGDPKAKKSR